MHRSMERNVALSEVTSRLGLKFGMRAGRDMGDLGGSVELPCSRTPTSSNKSSRNLGRGCQNSPGIPLKQATHGQGLIGIVAGAGERLAEYAKVPTLSPPKPRRQGWGTHFPVCYCAGASDGAAGVGVSADTSGATIGLSLTVARICSRRLKTLSRSTCLTRPSPEASVVTLRANS